MIVYNKFIYFEFIFKLIIGFDIIVLEFGFYVFMVIYFYLERFI